MTEQEEVDKLIEEKRREFNNMSSAERKKFLNDCTAEGSWEVIKAIVLVTCVANQRVGDLIRIRKEVLVECGIWFCEEVSKVSMPQALANLVIKGRDATEKALGFEK